MAKRIHFLGIGGSGASAAAAIAEGQGFEVTGCDLQPHNEFTTQFKNSQLLVGHNPKHLHLSVHPGGVHTNILVTNILVVTPAIFSLDPENPELLAAKKKGIPIMTWQKFTGEYLTKGKFVIAVCGTHGKTTTTAMIAKILEDNGLDPTVLLGAIVPKWGTNYRIPRQKVHDREYFIIEADEFNDNFLHLKPDINVVTNIEMDHPEYFKDFEAVKKSFKKFLLQTKTTVVANLTDSGVAEVVKVTMKQSGIQYLDYSKNELGITLKIPGEFNKSNARAAFQVGLLLGIDPRIIQKSLSGYPGVSRRFEYIGEYRGSKVYSDFGHHPTEIAKTMEAARQKFPKERIWLIYEPHMFTRTKALFDDFVKVFRQIPTDKIIITDIYPSREVDEGIVSSKQLAEAVGYDRLVYHSKNEPLSILKSQIQKGDIVFFMGAGNIDKLAKELAG
ncbi:MAG: Mur ligase family protein [Candidatus Daviesbacteria bacterium]|nr:Mur ligase family protein [Candidatus Daviesbacteria bacterium]